MNRILYITDDLSDFSKERWLKAMGDDYSLTIIDVPEWRNEDFTKYDAIVMDYGFMGDDVYHWRRIAQSGAKLGWCGAMAQRYNTDAQRLFPKLKFLHNLPSAELGDFGWLIDHMFEKKDIDPNKQDCSKNYPIKNSKSTEEKDPEQVLQEEK